MFVVVVNLLFFLLFKDVCGFGVFVVLEDIELFEEFCLNLYEEKLFLLCLFGLCFDKLKFINILVKLFEFGFNKLVWFFMNLEKKINDFRVILYDVCKFYVVVI